MQREVDMAQIPRQGRRKINAQNHQVTVGDHRLCPPGRCEVPGNPPANKTANTNIKHAVVNATLPFNCRRLQENNCVGTIYHQLIALWAHRSS